MLVPSAFKRKKEGVTWRLMVLYFQLRNFTRGKTLGQLVNSTRSSFSSNCLHASHATRVHANFKRGHVTLEIRCQIARWSYEERIPLVVLAEAQILARFPIERNVLWKTFLKRWLDVFNHFFGLFFIVIGRASVHELLGSDHLSGYLTRFYPDCWLCCVTLP